MTTDWTIGYVIGGVVVLAVVVLETAILVLAKQIGDEEPKINAALEGAVGNSAPLAAARADTADTVLIPQVATGVDAVLAEGLEHHLFLGRVLGKVKS